MLVQLALTVLGAVLFALAHPGFLLKNGSAFVGFIALIPIFLAVKKSSVKRSIVWGVLYGSLSYSLFTFWLVNYSVSLFVCAVISYAIILGIVFTVMKLVSIKSRFSMYVMALVWCVYEYLRTLGPFGFSYGIIGYTQWQNPLMLSLSSLCGVWGASLCCAFFSAFIASVFIKYKYMCIREYVIPFSVLVVSIVFLTVYHFKIFSVLDDASFFRTVNVMSVQNNTDSEKTGIDVYKKDIKVLINLTESCFNDSMAVDFVLWPETAVVPPVQYYYYNRIDYGRFNAIVEVLHFISRKNACFVIGNQHSEKDSEGIFRDYNAALIFDSSYKSVIPPEPEVYRKTHLVPFAECIPLKLLSFISDPLCVWTPGRFCSVFSKRGICFCTPICFEDTFGSLCRKFVRNGAKCFFELSNDSWAKSDVCQWQHVSMAVFRSAENMVPAVRSTGSGVSCYINQFGRIEPGIIEEFEQGAAIYSVNVPLEGMHTLYTAFGDWLVVCEICLLIWFCMHRLVKRLSYVEKKRKME